MKQIPFIYGCQYYRAPTPARECWAGDLANMRALGMTDVKFWVQWRWNNRREGGYDWSDLDELMDIAGRNGLRVTLNLIMDVAPVWLYRRHPDAVMIDSSGRPARTTATLARQIGGVPGPCYCHPGALEARRDFTAEAVRHFKGHPAMAMWDVWNEPENSMQARDPDMERLYCYCPHCRVGFIAWLQARYPSLGRLNQVWGRCYLDWDEVELPYDSGSVGDFVDWREFHLDKMTAEAKWRCDLVRGLDPEHLVYLHVVTNVLTGFNHITCVDDYALAAHCDFFGASVIDDDFIFTEARSAAGGKVLFNAEWHLNFGSASMHPRIITRDLFIREALRQFATGMFGILFWQYRPELLGTEAPAWGLTNPDGGMKAVTRHAGEFIQRLAGHTGLLMSTTADTDIAIWRGRKNEIFHFCMDGNLQRLRAEVSGYVGWLGEANLNFRFMSGEELAGRRFGGIKLLIMPAAYYMTEEEAAGLDAFVRAGGVVIAGAHLAAYNATAGRHAMTVPGGGLAASWGISETETCSSCHCADAFSPGTDLTNSADAAKALAALGGGSGQFFPITLGETEGFGAWRRAELDGGADGEVIGHYHGTPMVVRKAVGEGVVYYAGTWLGLTAGLSNPVLSALVARACRDAGIEPVCAVPGIRVDFLRTASRVEFIVIINRLAEDREVTLEVDGDWRGVFYDQPAAGGRFAIRAGTAELYHRS